MKDISNRIAWFIAIWWIVYGLIRMVLGTFHAENKHDEFYDVKDVLIGAVWIIMMLILILW